jgi:hypothetical protein
VPTKKIFFSHATEDKKTVLQVHAELIARFPDIDAWIDTYEIVGGESLLDKIAEGMDDAEKFFVFLSPSSITKPWVQRELNRALTQEIKGVKPEYVVPVLLGNIGKIPPFLEEKKYIDLHRQTVAEWTAEMKASIDGKDALRRAEAIPNLQAKWSYEQDRPNVGGIKFSVVSWAEDISFTIQTAMPVIAFDHAWEKGGFRGGYTSHSGSIEYEGRFYVNYALDNTKLVPGDEFQVRMRFPKGVLFTDAILEVRQWDGSGPSLTLMRAGGSGIDTSQAGVDGPDEEDVPAA